MSSSLPGSSPPSLPRVGDLLRLRVEDLAFGEDAVCRANGYVLFVPRVLPGEEIEARVTESGRKYGRAEPVRILEPSPARVAPKCRHFDRCGGCTWQHLRYDAQVRTKGELLRRLLLHRAGAEAAAALRPVRGMESPWGHREKVQLAVSGRAGAPRIGFYRRRSHDIVDIEECPVQPEGAEALIPNLRAAVAAARIEPRDEDRGRGALRHLVLRHGGEGPGATHLTVVASEPHYHGRRPFEEALRKMRGGPLGVSLNLNAEKTSRVLGEETRHVAGATHWTCRVAGFSFRVSPASFFQTNLAAAAMLVEEVLDAVPAGAPPRMLDLYAGVGLFSVALASRAREVVAVEQNAAAVEDGIHNATANGAERVRFVVRAAERAVADPSLGRFPFVVADPPREGLAPGVMEGIVRGCRARRLVLVSCDPLTLVRDLVKAQELGGRVERIVPVDMFPHTHHLEAVAVVDF